MRRGLWWRMKWVEEEEASTTIGQKHVDNKDVLAVEGKTTVGKKLAMEDKNKSGGGTGCKRTQ